MQKIQKGTILNETYEIIEEIGSGGGGIVFKAKHLRLNTEVVVKKIKDEVLGRIDSRKEADILKKLKHPYLPRVYDFIELEDAVYTVMDYISGENLSDALKRNGRFPQEQVKRWAEQLGEAIAYLHGQTPPIIHSDIKLANIMLTEENNICLIDFNVSLAMGESAEASVGISAGFSPPEQYHTPELYTKFMEEYTIQNKIPSQRIDKEWSHGIENNKEVTLIDATEILDEEKTELLELDKTEILNVENVRANIKKTDYEKKRYISKKVTDSEYVKYLGKGIDERSDIYSLGATLYIMLTGKMLVFDFDKQNVKEELSQYASEGFSQVLVRMLEIAPEKRYKNGSDFLDAIRNCYKLDKEYIAKRRKRFCIQLIIIIIVASCILLIFWTAKKNKMKRDNIYYGLIEQAKIAMDENDYREAEQYILDARESKEEQIDSYEAEVLLLYRQKLYENCVEKGMEYINAPVYVIKTEDEMILKANICYIIGNAHYEMKDYNNALLLLKEAIDINRNNPLYYRDYAICLAKTGNTEEAKKQLETGIQIGMEQDSLYVVNGEIAFIEGQLEKATDYFLKCIEITGDESIRNRAILSCSDGYRKLGEEYINQEIELLESYSSDANFAVLERLADAYGRMAANYPEEAKDYYKKALTIYENIYDGGYSTYQVRENIAIIYENLDELEKASEIFMVLAQEYPDKYEIYKRLAFLEADKQQEKKNEQRNYHMMRQHYECAEELYDHNIQDMEMEMLKNMMEELKNGGWF